MRLIRLSKTSQPRSKKTFQIPRRFTDDDRELLLSIKRGSPNWELLKIDGVEALPAVRWKLQNLEKLQEKKRTQLIEQLTKVLMKKEMHNQD
jgi:hypothetical protein